MKGGKNGLAWQAAVKGRSPGRSSAACRRSRHRFEARQFLRRRRSSQSAGFWWRVWRSRGSGPVTDPEPGATVAFTVPSFSLKAKPVKGGYVTVPSSRGMGTGSARVPQPAFHSGASALSCRWELREDPLPPGGEGSERPGPRPKPSPTGRRRQSPEERGEPSAVGLARLLRSAPSRRR